MKTKRYPLVAAALVSSPWAIHRDKLDVIRRLALRWSGLADGGNEPLAYDDDELIDEMMEEEDTDVSSGVAVVPVRGVICHRAPMIMRSSGLTSAEWIGREAKRLGESSKVSKIVFTFDTPGGSTDGVQEAADAIYSLRGVKPTVGIASAAALSAGWWLLSQCEEVLVTPSGSVGSQGVYMMHVDYSKMNEIVGIDPTYISAGEYKVEGNPDEPLDKDAKEFFQYQVDKFYTRFVDAVARGRGRASSDVAQNFGKGRSILSDDALAAGMVDGIISFDDLIGKILGGRKSTPSGRSVSVLRKKLDLQIGR